MTIPVEWLKHIPADKKEDYEAAIRASTIVLSGLRKILLDRISAIHAEEGRTTDYDSPAWPFKQASRNGKHTAYSELLALLTFKAKE